MFPISSATLPPSPPEKESIKHAIHHPSILSKFVFVFVFQPQIFRSLLFPPLVHRINHHAKVAIAMPKNATATSKNFDKSRTKQSIAKECLKSPYLHLPLPHLDSSHGFVQNCLLRDGFLTYKQFIAFILPIPPSALSYQLWFCPLFYTDHSMLRSDFNQYSVWNISSTKL